MLQPKENSNETCTKRMKLEQGKQSNTSSEREQKASDQSVVDERYALVRGLRYVIPYETETYHWPRDRYEHRSIAWTLADMFGGHQTGDGETDGQTEQPAAAGDSKTQPTGRQRPGDGNPPAYAVQYWALQVAAGRIRIRRRRERREDPEPLFESELNAEALMGRKGKVGILRHMHERVTSADMPQVLHEDDTMLICNKPPGLPTTNEVGGFACLGAVLVHMTGDASLKCAHRLDLGVSGALVVAKGGGVQKALMARFEKREGVLKVYVARVLGTLPINETRVIDQAIKWDKRAGRAAVVGAEEKGGKTCRTDVRPLLDFPDGTSLVECTLHTGRTHQIRCHLAWLGHPIANDELYGGQAPSEEGRTRVYSDDEAGTLRQMFEANSREWCSKCAWCHAAVTGEAVHPPPLAPAPIWLHAQTCAFVPDGPRADAPLPQWARA
jgi:23S rRNA-/tRNA-specific pseudouridylate synthase